MELRQELQAKNSKIIEQKEKINQLSFWLQSEKKKSRATIAKLMNNADLVIAEAHSIKSEAVGKIAAMDASLDSTQYKHKEALLRERQQYSKQLSSGECIVQCIYFVVYICNHLTLLLILK